MATKKSSKKSAKKVPAKRKVGQKAKAAPARARARAETLKMTSCSPSFTVDDLAKSLAWYRDVIGFAVAERWEREGKLMGVELRAGNVSLMIGQDDWKKGRDRKKGEGFRIYCETRGDLDSLARAIESRGGSLDQQPTDQPWGSRDFSMTDPDGFKITIAAAAKR
jgi:uncharacterized glyoxalase superfamily protein PhnB